MLSVIMMNDVKHECHGAIDGPSKWLSYSKIISIESPSLACSSFLSSIAPSMTFVTMLTLV
jgi:hypothetical protein